MLNFVSRWRQILTLIFTPTYPFEPWDVFLSKTAAFDSVTGLFQKHQTLLHDVCTQSSTPLSQLPSSRSIRNVVFTEQSEKCGFCSSTEVPWWREKLREGYSYSSAFTYVPRSEVHMWLQPWDSGFFLSPAATAEEHDTQELSVLLHLCSSYAVLLSAGLLLCHLSRSGVTSGPAGSSLCATTQPCLSCPQPRARWSHSTPVVHLCIFYQ